VIEAELTMLAGLTAVKKFLSLLGPPRDGSHDPGLARDRKTQDRRHIGIFDEP